MPLNDSVKLNEVLFSLKARANKFLVSRNFPILFSFFYALLLGFFFYPGVLYSDSVDRWNLAMCFAENGLMGCGEFSDHHPVIPSIIMSLFFSLTKEVGFFIFFQSFLCAYALFFLCRTIMNTSLSAVLCSVLLFLPLNQVYSIFHAYDSFHAALVLFFSACLVRFIRNFQQKQLYYMAGFFFLMVSWRLNTIAMLPFILCFIVYIQNKRGKNKLKNFLFGCTFALSAIAPFLITKSINLRPGRSWAVSIGFEYFNLATKSKDTIHSDFIQKVGFEKDVLQKHINYSSLYEIGPVSTFLYRIKSDTNLSQQLLSNYIRILRNEPGLFFSEKRKYISSLLGFSNPIVNIEVGKWRNSTTEYNWEAYFREFGFIPNSHREEFIDDYFTFTNEVIPFIFKPYIVFLACFVFVIIIVFTDRNIAKLIAVPAVLSLLYYSTFFITASSHELRFFFSSLFLIQGVFISTIALLYAKAVNSMPLRWLILFSLFGLFLFLNLRFSDRKMLQFEKIVSKENALIINGNCEVFLFKNSLFYVNKKPTEQVKKMKFYLHVFPEDSSNFSEKGSLHSFENLDFWHYDHAINLPWLSGKSHYLVAVRKLPDYDIKAIQTGQFSDTSVLWESGLMTLPN